MAADDDPPTTPSTGKQPLKLDMDELLRADKDKPVANLVVVSSAERRRMRRSETANRPSESDSVESLASQTDDDLKQQIGRLSRFGSNLPDKGEKAMRRVELLEKELQRRSEYRNQRQVADERKNPVQEHRNFNGDPDEHKQAAGSSTFGKFGELLMGKLDNGKPVAEQNTTVGSSDTAFHDEMTYLKPDNKRRRSTVAKLSNSKKPKSLIGPKGFSPWTNNRAQQKYGSLNGSNLSSRPSAQGKPPLSFTLKNGSNGLSSKCTNDDKEDCSIVLVDEEEPDVTEKMKEPERRRSKRIESSEGKIFYPSREDPESLEIFRSELKCLEPGECLTSTIMNFYIRYLQQLCSTSDRSKQKFYFFNTYFYSKLQEAMTRQNEETFFIKFRRWWKGVNIFEKTYIFLPVNEDKHWSLVILCISDEEDSGPVLLHLDSLGLHSSPSIFKNVKSLLENEWKYLKEDGEAVNIPIPDSLKENLSEKIDSMPIEAPRQTNDYDCGLFVLYYIERFIQDAPEKMRQEHLSMFGKKWFKAQDASSLRLKIKKILMDEFQKTPAEPNSLWEPVCLPTPDKRAKPPHLADMS